MNVHTLKQVEKAAKFWYNSTTIDACCLAENRLDSGEIPYPNFIKNHTNE